MATISIKQLLDAGVHFGHQTGRWNPKMKSFIFGERNGIHIIDLQQTRQFFNEAINFMTTLAAQGKTVLFVGTKSQAREAIEEEARRCGMYWITNRWLGGLLTNFSTVQNSIKRYRELETMRDNGFYEKLSKKEVARLERERKKLEKNLRGIRDIDRCPDVLFVVDSKQEAIAVQEAAKLNIPIIAIVDTNSDPDLIDYVIPGNDDALRAVKLFAGTMADAILTGRSVYTARVETEMQEAQEKAAKEEAQRQAAKEAKEAAKLSAEKAQAKQVEKPVAKARVAKKVQVSVPQEQIAPPREVSVAVDEQSESPVQEVVIKEPEESGVETAAEVGKVAVEETSASTAPEETPVAAVEEEPKQAPAKKKAPAKKAKSKAATTAKVKIAATKSKKTASKSKKTASTKSKATKRTAKTSDAAAVKKSSA